MIQGDKVLKKLERKVQKSNADALLVNDALTIEYLTNFYSQGAFLLISKNENPFYFVDSMNASLAKKNLKHTKVSCIVAQGAVINALMLFLSDKKVKTLAFNDRDVSAREYEMFLQMNPKMKLTKIICNMMVSDFIDEIREIKTREEIALIRQAAKKTVQIWKEVKKKIKPGLSEKQIAAMIDLAICRRGYKNSFPTIVAVGKNTAYPHAVPTEKKFKKNEHVLADFGIIFKGYCSDLTRTLYNGKMNPQIEVFKKNVLSAQKKAIESIKPGVSLAGVSKKISLFFKDKKLGNYVLHGLGHGVGRNVHEAPFWSQNCCKCFKKGMIITIEPGLYKKNLGGVREEDMVLVTDTGCEVLTK
ncbi:MAG: Xaa-Pro peptidase family protein [Candidatus Omnitrophota bacterium]|nr:Xaa-Pro peptidase family protein [Candidatus Omnitrophota bacterium]MBU1895182.1 Xaa-Pro peptidase family protein [Candidatus Omnitrophota bacterium]